MVEAYIRWATVAVAVILLGFPFIATAGQITVGTVIVIEGMVTLSLLVLTVLASWAFAQTQWEAVTSKEGQFSVEMPVRAWCRPAASRCHCSQSPVKLD